MLILYFLLEFDLRFFLTQLESSDKYIKDVINVLLLLNSPLQVFSSIFLFMGHTVRKRVLNRIICVN